MPQLDKVTFYLQTHISYYIFIIFYLFVLRLFLPRLVRAMKLREYLAEDYFIAHKMVFAHTAYFKAFQKEIILTLLNSFIKILTVYLNILDIFFKNNLKNIEREFFMDSYVYTLKKMLFLKRY